MQTALWLWKHKGFAVKNSFINIRHSSFLEQVVHRFEFLLVCQHSLREAEQPDPGAAIEVETAAAQVDGPLQMGVAGDEKMNVQTHRMPPFHLQVSS